VEGIERIRTKGKAHDRILELTIENVAKRSPVHLATLHANAAADAKDLLTRANQALHPVESFLTEVSPTVGTHAGPGTVGLAFMAGI
jgi:fatty acid-binding protein DegV